MNFSAAVGKPIRSGGSGKRVFLDNPDAVPGIEFGEPAQATVERTVVASDFFTARLPAGRILVQHGCWFRPVLTPVKSHLTLARVAGYRHAVYGLPETQYPVLFEHPDNPDLLISSTPLRNFVESRFAPGADWRLVAGRIAAWLNGESGIAPLEVEPPVGPTFSAGAPLPPESESRAFSRSCEWFGNHVFFEYLREIGVFEGYTSNIEPNGRQYPRPLQRGDCTGEAAMIPALDHVLHGNHAAGRLSARIMGHLFGWRGLVDDRPASPTYGGVDFYEHVRVFYGDDNCRAALGCLLASELTGNFQYSKNIIRCLLSILRTTGPEGFRRGFLRLPQAFAGGKTWKDFENEPYVEYRPHYQAYMWAGFLQGYALTGHRPFLDKAKSAIRMTMAVFPHLVWTNGITQEYARLLLPLAFLIQIEDTAEHRAWLRTVAETLLATMADCGAIREMMGDPAYGKYPAPRSNAEYGTTEAALIQQNGDPACDLLYTANYAFVGLHEAGIATGDAFYLEAENRLAEFLCRIQVRSTGQEALDGCWMRGFDYELWEYFGSSADSGWGAWSVEAGWTNTWIAATLGLRKLKRGLLCRQNAAHYRAEFPELLAEMSVVHPNPDTGGGGPAAVTPPGAE